VAATLIDAYWRGPADGDLPGGRILRCGEIYQVTDRDLESAHWEPVEKPKHKRGKPAGASGADTATGENSGEPTETDDNAPEEGDS
jgi:hypothetical protein